MLRIDEDVIGRDFLKPILDDLVSERVAGDIQEYRARAREIEAKIRRNYSKDEIDDAVKLTENLYAEQAAADATLKTFDDTELSRVKKRVLVDFNQTEGALTFGKRIEALIQVYVAKYNQGGDDGMRLYILGLVQVLFAQCLFGQEPNSSQWRYFTLKAT